LTAPVRQVLEADPDLDDFSGQILRWAGATLIFLIGGAHVLIAGEHFLAATYLGILFLANFAGAIAAAFALYWSPNRWGWLLGDAVAGGAFVGFIASRAVGLPGFEEEVGKWFSIAGLLCLLMEGAFVSLSLLALTPQGRAIVRMQQERINLEQAVGKEQPLEQPLLGMAPLKAPELIEQEMAEIRIRTSPNLVDLRKHVEPQVVKEQAQRSVLGYLRGIRNAFASHSASRQPGPLAALVVLAAVAILVVRRANGRDD
jgi:hypothetical protein